MYDQLCLFFVLIFLALPYMFNLQTIVVNFMNLFCGIITNVYYANLFTYVLLYKHKCLALIYLCSKTAIYNEYINV